MMANQTHETYETQIPDETAADFLAPVLTGSKKTLLMDELWEMRKDKVLVSVQDDEEEDIDIEEEEEEEEDEEEWTEEDRAFIANDDEVEEEVKQSRKRTKMTVEEELADLRNHTPDMLPAKRVRRAPERFGIVDYLNDPNEKFAKGYKKVVGEYYDGLEDVTDDEVETSDTQDEDEDEDYESSENGDESESESESDLDEEDPSEKIDSEEESEGDPSSSSDENDEE